MKLDGWPKADDLESNRVVFVSFANGDSGRSCEQNWTTVRFSVPLSFCTVQFYAKLPY